MPRGVSELSRQTDVDVGIDPAKVDAADKNGPILLRDFERAWWKREICRNRRTMGRINKA